MKILLVDDEPPARHRLRALLAEESGIEVVGECGSAAEARRTIGPLQCDVVLLDVQMPGEDGVQLARWLDERGHPLVILVTAHARFAVDAFEAHAVDYLLKPVRPARLRQALLRARRLLENPPVEPAGHRRTGLLRRLPVKTNNQMHFIELEDIQWIEAAGNYMIIHASGQNHVLRETMATLERGLPPSQFIRVNRSVIVNADAIQSAHKTGRGEFTLALKDGKCVDVTCGLRELEQRMKFGR